MPRSRHRLLKFVFSPVAGLLFIGSLILICCILPSTGVFQGPVPPPRKILWGVCIAEGPDNICVFAQVDDLVWRPWPAEPSQVHNAAAIYEFVISPDGTIRSVEFPLTDGTEPGWPNVVFAEKSGLYIFEEGSTFGEGREPALYRITPDGIRILGDSERDQMFAALQLNDASPSEARKILEMHTKDSGWKIEEWHGGVEDLGYDSDEFRVRFVTESKDGRQSLLVKDVRTSEVLKCLLSVAGNDVQVERDRQDDGSTAR